MTRIIDLSLPIDNQMRGVDIQPATRLEVDGWNTSTLSLYSHCGTHMDAPKHFVPDGGSIDHQELDACVGPARIVNLVPIEPRASIGVDELGDVAQAIQAGDRLLLRTDWHKRYGTQEYREQLPRISVELARWLVQRHVALIGVEPPSVADVNNLTEITEVHQTLLRGSVVIVEGLANLDQAQSEIVHFIALPLRVVDGDGTPVRAIAVEDG